MTPSDIDVLIHYHGSVVQHPRHHAPGVRMSTEMFLDKGLLEKDSDGRIQTSRGGMMLVEALCQVTLPQKEWVMPQGSDLESELGPEPYIEAMGPWAGQLFTVIFNAITHASPSEVIFSKRRVMARAVLDAVREFDHKMRRL